MKLFNDKSVLVVEGRKNFAMSISDGIVHVTGGLDSNGRFLSDLWSFSTRDKRWEKLQTTTNKAQIQQQDDNLKHNDILKRTGHTIVTHTTS